MQISHAYLCFLVTRTVVNDLAALNKTNLLWKLIVEVVGNLECDGPWIFKSFDL